MTQNERWLARYNEVKNFIEKEHRNPSKYVPEEMALVNWVKQQRKLVNKGDLMPERVARLRELLELCERYKRKNQYQ